MNDGTDPASDQQSPSDALYMNPRDGKPPTGQVYAYVLDPHGSRDIVVQSAKDAAHAIERQVPEVRSLVQNSRLFVRRATRFLVNNGIEQILDLGSGLPTNTNTHEVAQDVEPDTRIVYVDNDPMTEAQAADMLVGTSNVNFIHEDICDVDAVLGHPKTRELIDLNKPVGLLMASIFHLISEEECQHVAGINTHELVHRYVKAMPSGSYLAFEHATSENVEPDRIQAVTQNAHVIFRGKDDIRRYFDGTILVSPYADDRENQADIIWSNRWKSREPERADTSGKWIWSGVAQIP